MEAEEVLHVVVTREVLVGVLQLLSQVVERQPQLFESKVGVKGRRFEISLSLSLSSLLVLLVVSIVAVVSIVVVVVILVEFAALAIAVVVIIVSS